MDLLADTVVFLQAFKPTLVILLALGIPVVLVLAWYHGERGRQRISGPELLILAGLFVVGGGIFALLDRGSGDDGASFGSTEARAPAEGSTAPDLSIAVLPFENRSADEEDAFFVDGIHDDILTQLAKISALKVISRTSVMEYRERTGNLREIAQALGVRTVLEGGVQRAGDRVRINVQLIDAVTDEHLWAETYDRELTIENVFAIQSELATAIAVALEARMSPEEGARIAAMPTESMEAYEHYLRGR